MSAVDHPRFLPLVCPDCNDDLAGRAEDLVAFCTSCGTVWRCDRDALERWPAGRVTEVPEGDGPAVALPFWVRGSIALPAFFGGRPLTVARTVARGLAQLPAGRGIGRWLPLGARIPPEAVAKAAPLLGSAPEAGAAVPALLAVPVRVGERRLHLPGSPHGLFPDDVHDLPQLLELGARELPAGREVSPKR
jgi:hypothetical protein